MARNKTNSTTTTTYTDKQGNVQTRTTTTKTRSKTSSHGVSVGASTNAWGVVSLILIIGLIATVFFAYYNSTRKDGVVQYFSPSRYLTNISSTEFVLPGGTYYVQTREASLLTAVFLRIEGYIEVDGRIYESENTLGWWDFESGSKSFEFNINGVVYYSYVNSGGYKVVDLPTTTVTVGDFPDFSRVAEKFVNVDSVPAFFEAFDSLPRYLDDFFVYQANFLKSFLPWNSVSSNQNGGVPDLPQIWADAEEKNGIN